jgi:hypothetical protein
VFLANEWIFRGEQGKYGLRVSPKGFKLMRQKVKQITRKTRPLSFDQRVKELNDYLKGWLGVLPLCKTI